MSNALSSIVIVATILLAISCSKPTPQLPSNKGMEVDIKEKGLLELNQKLAQKEDSMLTLFASKNRSFKKNEMGFWYKIDFETNEAQITTDDTCTIQCKILSLDMKVLSEEKKRIVIGKKQLIVGLEEGLKLLKRGEKATFIIPWNLAFGRSGLNNIVKPYTSIIYIIEIK